MELYFKMEGISVYSLIQKLAQYPSDAIVTIEDDSLVIRESNPVEPFDWEEYENRINSIENSNSIY